MKPLYFDIRDLFQSIRLGWSGKKIWVGFRGLGVAYAGYTILVGLAHLLDGTTISQLWHRYGLFPGAVFGEFGVLGTCLHGLGMIFALGVCFISTSMICKITFQQIQGDDFFSSGDAWQFVEIDGRRYSHILDPGTGIGLTTRSSVTVIAADATTADGLASAVSVLGAKRGLALIERSKGASALVLQASAGEVQTWRSCNFPKN